MTNPPFGTKIDEVRPFVLETYELGHRLYNGVPSSQLLNGQDPDKLFLERDIQYLKEATKTSDGGRMVIVLPKQNLSGADQASVELRKWLFSKVKIIAVIDLPREAFQPYTGTKTSLVFLQKVRNPSEDYPIFMAVSEAVGHDRRGTPIYRKDENGNLILGENELPIIYNDLPDIFDNWLCYKKGEPLSQTSPSCFVINSATVRKNPQMRLDAWYWDTGKNDLVKQLEDLVGNGIQDIARLSDLCITNGIFYPGRHKRNYVEPSDASLPFYSGSQILQIRPFDIKHQPKDYGPVQNHLVKQGWILVTRSGTTGRVTMVSDNMDGAMVSEHVIRVIVDESIIDPYYVYAYLASERVGRVLMERGIYASVVDHLSPDFVGSIPIPRLNPAKEKEIANIVRQAEELKAKATKLFENGVLDIEEFILKNNPT